LTDWRILLVAADVTAAHAGLLQGWTFSGFKSAVTNLQNCQVID
jgi:hypothetical protein